MRWFFMAVPLLFACLAPQASRAGDKAGKATSTLSEQKSVNVTVYNNNLALVREKRSVSLAQGETALRFEGVPELIQPETVYIRSMAGAGDVVILEQNYEYDLLTPERLMEKFVNNDVKLVRVNPATGEEITKKAVLLSTQGGGVYKLENEITFGDVGRPVLPKLPENFVSHPTLVWLLKAAKTGARDLEATYLTQGLTWKADYVFVMSESDDKADLTGWVTMNNTSGARYKDARLQLVAGDVNLVPRPSEPRGGAVYMKAMAAADASRFAEESFFEYHLYTLDQPTTIEQNQQKQIKLLSAEKIQTRKIYRYSGEQGWFTSRYDFPMTDKKVEVYIEFKNAKESGLGMPLPKGIIRVYKADSRGDEQFVGEDQIDHTPKDEKVEVHVGAAFDVAAERKQLRYSAIASGVHESTWEIKIRNHKKEPVEVEVLEPVYGDWEVTKSTFPAERKDANTILFKVPCPPDKEAILNYTVRVREPGAR